MVYKVEEIEGIGPVYAAKLVEAGIKTTSLLLKSCGDPKDRDRPSGSTPGEHTAKLIVSRLPAPEPQAMTRGTVAACNRLQKSKRDRDRNFF